MPGKKNKTVEKIREFQGTRKKIPSMVKQYSKLARANWSNSKIEEKKTLEMNC